MSERIEQGLSSKKKEEQNLKVEYTTSEDWSIKAQEGFLKDCLAKGLLNRRTPNFHKPCEI